MHLVVMVVEFLLLVYEYFPRIKISVNMDISVIRFYGYIRNIGGYFYKNIGSTKIICLIG